VDAETAADYKDQRAAPVVNPGAEDGRRPVDLRSRTRKTTKMKKKADSDTPQVAELDLAIPDMNDEDDEKRASALLKGIKGIQFVRILPRGAFIRYHPDTIAGEAIVAALHHAGLRASTFQDSKTGKTGRSSQ
jgi:hypothetical protein